MTEDTINDERLNELGGQPLFATKADMEEAWKYVDALAKANEEPSAVLTAVFVYLNTYITQRELQELTVPHKKVAIKSCAECPCSTYENDEEPSPSFVLVCGHLYYAKKTRELPHGVNSDNKAIPTFEIPDWCPLENY